jgi:hypothetical protein
VAEVSVAVPVGLDIYIVFDRSGSMANRPPPNNGFDGRLAIPQDAVPGDCPIDLTNPPAQDSKWCFATNALAGFFATDPGGDVRAALQFMTPPVPEYLICSAEEENPHASAVVDLALLPASPTDDLITVLDADAPHSIEIGGILTEEHGTRIEGALNGIAMYTAAKQEPARKMIGVLITDGYPTGCEEDIAVLEQISSDHLAATGIPTFIIGMTGANPSDLEALAQNAGAPEHGPEFCDAADATCHYWTVGDGDPAAFTAALKAITDAVVIPCEYNIPLPTSGMSIDPRLVAVTFDDGMGGTPIKVGKVDDQTSCDPADGGWFFDDNDRPTTIQLCQTSCELANESPAEAAVELLYGCTQDIE